MAESAPAAAAHEHHRLAWRRWVPWALVVLATTEVLRGQTEREFPAAGGGELGP